MFARFVSMNSEAEIEYLRMRGAKEPERHTDGYRMIGFIPNKDSGIKEALPCRVKLIFPINGFGVVAINCDCHIINNIVLVPQKDISELWNRAKAKGVAI